MRQVRTEERSSAGGRSANMRRDSEGKRSVGRVGGVL
jgi:hypothetical protein